jgi:hypothetical protein
MNEGIHESPTAVGAAVVACVIVLSSCGTDERAAPTAPTSAGTAAGDAKTRPMINFGDSLDSAFTQAANDGRRVMVFFTMDANPYGHRMEQETLTSAEVVRVASQFVCVRLEIDKRGQLVDKYRVWSVPQTMVLTADGAAVDACAGYKPASEFCSWLESALSQDAVTWAEFDARMKQYRPSPTLWRDGAGPPQPRDASDGPADEGSESR